MGRKQYNQSREVLKDQVAVLRETLVRDAMSNLEWFSSRSPHFTSHFLKIALTLKRSSMRQIWSLSSIYIKSIHAGCRAPRTDGIHNLELAVYRAGLIYYTARKYGMSRAIVEATLPDGQVNMDLEI